MESGRAASARARAQHQGTAARAAARRRPAYPRGAQLHRRPGPSDPRPPPSRPPPPLRRRHPRLRGTPTRACRLHRPHRPHPRPGLARCSFRTRHTAPPGRPSWLRAPNRRPPRVQGSRLLLPAPGLARRVHLRGSFCFFSSGRREPEELHTCEGSLAMPKAVDAGAGACPRPPPHPHARYHPLYALHAWMRPSAGVPVFAARVCPFRARCPAQRFSLQRTVPRCAPRTASRRSALLIAPRVYHQERRDEAHGARR